MKYPLFLLFLTASLLSCKKDEVRLPVNLSAYCKGCAIEYYDGQGAMHRDTMFGHINYTWTSGDAIVDTVAGWTAGYHVVLGEKEEPRISACPLGQDSAVIIVRAEGDILTRTITAHVGCAHLP
jgi:hypothetical protein